jgi:hypothetical protein
MLMSDADDETRCSERVRRAVVGSRCDYGGLFVCLLARLGGI